MTERSRETRESIAAIDISRSYRGKGLLFLLSAALLILGCRPRLLPLPLLPASVPPPGIESFIVGRSVEGRPIECVAAGEAGDVLLIIASIHGDETGGTPLVRHLIKVLEARRDLVRSRRVVVIPEANPDGVARRSRHNARGIDLNRNFDTPNWSPGRRAGEIPFSEPESRAIAMVIRTFRPDRIVSIHEPLGCIDYDGHGEAMAMGIAEYSDLPVRKLGGRPGSLGSYAGVDKGIPTITLELPPGASEVPSRVLWEAYGTLLLSAVRYPDPVRELEISGFFRNHPH
ncbi:M14 family zinc carboxypeptidase [Desulfococcus sp.]|uniref:M14 family zinc carboxypeptidase n=1 Tax=Desulfococcus sp. TaxID=2025834 RepID=UPI0035932151